MIKNVCIVIIMVFLVSCNTERTTKKATVKELTIPTYNYKELKPLLHKKDGKTYVINFWATWCAPCVKELPAFEQLYAAYNTKNVEVILVSLDFPKQVKNKLLPFVKKKNLTSKVVHFDDVNEQFWIKDIAEEWTGAIPATLIYNENERKFYEQSFDYETLKNELETFLNN